MGIVRVARAIGAAVAAVGAGARGVGGAVAAVGRGVAGIGRWVGRTFDLRDLATLIGLVLIGVGLMQTSLTAALAVPGVLVFLLAVVPPFVRPPTARGR